ncbi:phosphoglucosamine mutase [Nodularia harveyana UHCC-0300]|uniref:Phosphoglucosamine mutase n=1 Tax=Nodularia harveyana UHCC-0300 TaxID=2974287 RepID=A0ABU5UGN3_9CYAN|nr:phosphoglucosamine mutase [Nodularia harveyana]MEA5582717.1 phosphoglucosamine mutase [Nodularia harveyana UHCC-0300]
MVTSINRTPKEIVSSSRSESPTSATAVNGNLGLDLLSLPTTALFGTDGIRGEVGELLNAPLALHIGFWAGVVLQNQSSQPGPVILGQDSRNSSDMLAMALSAGLTASGVEVWYLGLCPTPTVAYLTSITEAIGGVMISASHNPPEDNGIKIFNGFGGKLSPALQAEIEAGLRGNTVTGKVRNCGRHYSRRELVSHYGDTVKQSLQKINNLQGLKIVLDLAWGAAVGLAPKIFTEMGAEVICLHNEADGDRINVNCGSTHLATLQATVQEHNADLGFAFDGDADRVLAVDHTGRQVDGDYILYLWGKHLQEQQQLPDNLIVSTVMANLGFERAWEEQGGKLIRTSVGDQYVQAEMMRTGGMLGGEQSGHILCRHYAVTGDGLLTALHIAALVKEAGVSLSQMLENSFETYPQLLRNVRVIDRDRRLNWQDCQPLQIAIAQAEAAMGDAGRILVRASGTEPLIRVMVEAANAELTNHWTNELVFQVQQHLAA